MSDTQIDPKMASAVVLVLDRVAPAIVLALKTLPGDVSEADGQWFNGVIFGCLAAYLHLNSETEVKVHQVEALFGTASAIISDSIDRYGYLDLDRYAGEVLGLAR